MLDHLIPEAFFEECHWALLSAITVATLFTLTLGADWLVKGASGLASQLGVPKVIVGATIVSLGTTAPECAVSVAAAWAGNPGLSLGNAVGSIIADTGLIFGGGCLLVTLPADRFLLSRQGWVQFGSAALLALLCYAAFFTQGSDATLERWAGASFLVLLFAYLMISMKWSRHRPEGAPPASHDDHEIDVNETASFAATKTKPRHLLRTVSIELSFIVVGLAVVVFSSEVLILAVSELARQAGVSDVVIASTLVAFGTSLPELIVGLTSIRRGHPELLVGNVIGADILNVLFVVGASATAMPLPLIDKTADFPEIFVYFHLPTMLAVLILFRVYIFMASKKGHFSQWMGWPLIILYVGFCVTQFALT